MGRNNADFHADVDQALQDNKITNEEANDLNFLGQVTHVILRIKNLTLKTFIKMLDLIIQEKSGNG